MSNSLFPQFEEAENLFSKETRVIKNMSKIKKQYYKNLLLYIDEYTYFNFLKLTDSNYGFNLSTMLPYYLNINVKVSMPLILYNKRYPDDEEIDPYKLILIEEEINNL